MWNLFTCNWRRSDVFIVNFDHISGVSIVDFEQVNTGGTRTIIIQKFIKSFLADVPILYPLKTDIQEV